MVLTDRVPVGRPRKASAAWRGSAFGLALEAPLPLPTIRAGEGSTGRRTVVRFDSASALDRAWPAAEAETLVDHRFPDGKALMRIARHREAGYRVWAPGHGRYIVSSDGGLIRAALPGRTWRWQRLFFAQVLPLAAALGGLEPFHASAVAIDGRAVAFVASAGTGKSSVAAHLVAGGAQLVTDDVLVLEPDGTGVIAHPGCGLVNLDEAELAEMDDRVRAGFGRRLGRSDKLHLAAEVIPRELPLGLVYFLRRRSSSGALTIARNRRPTQPLLASGFLAYLRSPERLVLHLDTCAKVSEGVGVFTVDVPAGVSARAVAEAVRPHAGTVLKGGEGR